MSQNGIPDGTQPPAHTGILDHLEQLAEKFLGRQNDAPPPVYDNPAPVVEHQLLTPPYAGMAPEAMGRYQQEVFGVLLTAATPGATLRLRTRCDFYTMTCYPNGAVAVDANDGVWVAISGTPPGIPVFTAGQFTNVPYRLDPGETLNIHGAEQQLSFSLDSSIDLVVVVVANTNVQPPYV